MNPHVPISLTNYQFMANPVSSATSPSCLPSILRLIPTLI